jgi:2-polyprenyl-6-methoxyphenol hydroxylase-like FAD-dependent oxidoreductase
MAYLTLFPVEGAMRANLMVYRDVDDPWLTRMRETPEAALRELMPRLGRITGDFTVTGPIRIRPADLTVAEGHRRAGVVLIGDSFCTSCPAGGTGSDKVFTDAERLCNVHIPQWLSSPGMGQDKIDAFYDDEAKTATDAWSTEKAFHLRTLSTSHSLGWRAQRWARFVLRIAQGLARRARKPSGNRPAAMPVGTPDAGVPV